MEKKITAVYMFCQFRLSSKDLSVSILHFCSYSNSMLQSGAKWVIISSRFDEKKLTK